MAESDIFYLSIGREVELFTEAWKSQLPILLKGPTGCGKTRLVEFMAQRLNRPLLTVSCNEDTSATDLLGRHLLIGGETVWTDGPVTRAVRQGAILYLDEVAEARPDAIVIIHSLTDYRRELFIDRTGETLKATGEFMLVASYNPGYQKSLKELKPSTRQRFVAHSMNYPPYESEVEVVRAESGVDASIAGKLSKTAGKIRSLQELSLMDTVSTRLIISAAKLIQSGIPPRLAVFAAVAEPLTDDRETLQALKHLIDLTF